MTTSNVPQLTRFIGKLSNHCSSLLFTLGNIETKLFSEDTRDIEIKKPVFITGVPRAGSTILLEMLESIDGVASHRYSDYPFLQTIVFWNKLFALWPGVSSEKKERAHQDGLFVNKDSPESMDEILWMKFFEDIHNPSVSNLLEQNTSNPEFEKFFLEHFKKLLFLRKGKRCACKNNYLVSRIPYLLKQFPDAKFIVPFRNPEDHVYSLVKQHKLIVQAQNEDKHALEYMNINGHFEFGQNFRPVNFGVNEDVDDVMAYWGEERWVQSYTKLWAMTYQYLLGLKSGVYGDAVEFVSYDALCDETPSVLKSIGDFTNLTLESNFIKSWDERLQKPKYYDNKLTDKQKNFIQVELNGIYQNLCLKVQ